MKKFNLRITGKIMAMNGVLLFLFVASLFYLSIEIGRGTSVIEQQNNYLVELQEASALGDRFADIRYWLADLAVSWLNESEEKAETAHQAFDSLLVELKKRDTDLAIALREQVNKYYKVAQSSVDAFIDGNRVLGNSLVAESRRKADVIESEISELMQNTAANARQAGATVIESNQGNRKAAIFLMIFVCALGGILSWIVSRSITIPLGKMSASAARIAKGDIVQTIEYHSGDEIGELADSFRAMLKALKNKAEAAWQLSKGEVDVEVDKASDADILGQAMIEMRDSLQSKAAAANQIADGNLDTEIKIASEQDVLGNAMVKMLENLKKSRTDVDQAFKEVQDNLKAARVVVDEINRVAEDLKEGKLSERAAVANAEGAFKNLVDGFNAAIDYILEPVNEAVKTLQQMADGDLTVSIQHDYKGDHALMKDAVNNTLAALNEILGQVSVAVEQVATGAGEVSSSAHSLSDGATKQASSLQEIGASMNEIAGQTKQNAENSGQANQLSESARDTAEEGNKQMRKMLTAMGDINKSSREISKIIKAIDEIAFQTNLLALNAAVEAARAGVHGKGFAVVAEEVRNLAQRSAKAAQETAELIEDSVNKVDNGTKLANVTAKALEQIVDGVAKVTDLVGEIAIASNEQAQGIGEVNSGLGQIDQVTQANTAAAEESASASEELSGQAGHLKQILNKFKLNNRVNAPSTSSFAQNQITIVEEPKISSDDEEAWGGKTVKGSGSDFIALDDDEFGKF